MPDFIEHLHITNFKSISSCEITDCKRINLFIGRPNVGKSNILEALSLFSIPFLRENPSKKLSNLIRVENEAELFYNGDYHNQKQAFIESSKGFCKLSYHPKLGLDLFINFPNASCIYTIDANFNVKAPKYPIVDSPIKRYTFNPGVTYKKAHAKYLIPPFGYNLFSILESYEDLKREVRMLFKEYDLDIAFDKSSQTIKVIQSTAKDDIFLIPYNSIADTLQRIIFYKSAIASNSNSVLLFEEPEAHSFPPYMAHLTQEMIGKKDDQFFVATHSPFILNDLLENGREELAVFMVRYENHETKVRRLSDEELHAVFQNGVDLFTNSESFV